MSPPTCSQGEMSDAKMQGQQTENQPCSDKPRDLFRSFPSLVASRKSMEGRAVDAARRSGTVNIGSLLWFHCQGWTWWLISQQWKIEIYFQARCDSEFQQLPHLGFVLPSSAVQNELKNLELFSHTNGKVLYMTLLLGKLSVWLC